MDQWLPDTNEPPDSPRLTYIITHGITAQRLMVDHLSWMQRHGFEVTLIAAPHESLEVVRRREHVDCIPVDMDREISPRRDLISFFRLWRTLRTIQPDIVNCSTPKAGLLGTLAAKLAGVPHRVYTLRGLRLETSWGFQRLLLWCGERLASACATQVICVSDSLRESYLRHRLCSPSCIKVLGPGSSNGIDFESIESHRRHSEANQRLRERLGIEPDEQVLGFAGRLTRDKGIVDLYQVFRRLRQSRRLKLLIVGGWELGDPLPADVRREMECDPDVVITGFVEETHPYYPIMDVLVFPSYREGFPNVPLEAGAAGLPVVGYAATGTRDAVQDGVTGSVVPVRDQEALAAATGSYLDDPRVRRQHGTAGKRRAQFDFPRVVVLQRLAREYVRMMLSSERTHSKVAAIEPFATTTFSRVEPAANLTANLTATPKGKAA